jgi:hypothetical protein
LLIGLLRIVIRHVIFFSTTETLGRSIRSTSIHWGVVGGYSNADSGSHSTAEGVDCHSAADKEDITETDYVEKVDHNSIG